MRSYSSELNFDHWGNLIWVLRKLSQAHDDLKKANVLEIDPFFNFLGQYFDRVSCYLVGETYFGRGNQQKQVKIDFIELVSSVVSHLNEEQTRYLTYN